MSRDTLGRCDSYSCEPASMRPCLLDSPQIRIAIQFHALVSYTARPIDGRHGMRGVGNRRIRRRVQVQQGLARRRHRVGRARPRPLRASMHALRRLVYPAHWTHPRARPRHQARHWHVEPGSSKGVRPGQRSRPCGGGRHLAWRASSRAAPRSRHPAHVHLRRHEGAVLPALRPPGQALPLPPAVDRPPPRWPVRCTPRRRDVPQPELPDGLRPIVLRCGEH